MQHYYVLHKGPTYYLLTFVKVTQFMHNLFATVSLVTFYLPSFAQCLPLVPPCCPPLLSSDCGGLRDCLSHTELTVN